MFFQKKKMVDLADLPKRNVNLPNGKAFVPKDGYGFVDLTKKRVLPSELRKQKGLGAVKSSSESVFSDSSSQNSGAFSFFDTPTPSSSSANSNNEDLMRKISSQISDLDSKLYKVEQRIELLERKAGVGDSSNSSGFGW